MPVNLKLLMPAALAGAAAVFVFSALVFAAPGHAAEPTAMHRGIDDAVLEVSVLSEADQDRYRRIFRAQAAGDWTTADGLIAKLDDRVLMGHVLYQRYMHPTAYRSKFGELRDWLAKYNDHPNADKIYKLAMSRRAGNAAPDSPLRRVFRPTAYHSAHATDGAGAEGRSPYGRTIAGKVRSLLARERPTQAMDLLDSATVRNRLDGDERDALMAHIAWSYYVEGKITTSLEMSREIATRNRRAAPLADWYAGIAAWRLGKPEVAAEHFEALTHAMRISDWTRSAAAFWAGRAYLAARQPEKVTPLLEQAAQAGMTFYGLLAQRQLGLEPKIDWSQPSLDPASLTALMSVEQVRRGVALAEIGEEGMAEAELRRAHGRLDPSLDRAMAALAARLDLPATQLSVGLAESRPMGASLFPVPRIQPEGGFTVDRALVFAVARQESKFIRDAESYSGARGLMQIMPSTAAHVTRDTSYRGEGAERLADPAVNLALGQTYLEELMNYGEPYANLFQMAVAYNAGPGNLARWSAQMGGMDDPLLFIESIPVGETRAYVERVVTNLWLYRLRLGQETPSLDAAAGGGWPVYKPLEPRGATFAGGAFDG